MTIKYLGSITFTTNTACLMKQLFTFLVISICCLSQSFANWSVSESGTKADLHDVILTSENIGYAVGDDAVVVKSLDGGETWSHKMIVRGETFKAIHFFDDDRGIVVGYRGEENKEGLMLRTYNGGESWFVTSPSEHAITDVAFISQNTGFICGHGGFLMRTDDGGDSWKQIYLMQNTSLFSDITFESRNVGYVTGDDVVMKTSDGGHTWNIVNNRATAELPNNMLESASFTSSESGAVKAWNHVAFQGMADDLSTSSQMNNTQTYAISKIVFPTSHVGFAAGNNGLLLHSGNGGQSWHELNHPLAETNFNSTAFFNESKGLFVGENGTILKSTGKYFSSNPTLQLPAMKIPLALSVYPNPVQYEANIKLDDAILNGELSIYNHLGQLVQKVSNVNGDQLSFATCQLTNGRYTFQLATKDEVVGVGNFVVVGDGVIGRS